MANEENGSGSDNGAGTDGGAGAPPNPEQSAGNAVPAVTPNPDALQGISSLISVARELPGKILASAAELKEVRKLATKDANDEFSLHNSIAYIFDKFTVAMRHDGKGAFVTRDFGALQSMIGSRYSNTLLKDAADVYARSQEPPLVKTLAGSVSALADEVKAVVDKVPAEVTSPESAWQWATSTQTAQS